jgi:hypothetical protein
MELIFEKDRFNLISSSLCYNDDADNQSSWLNVAFLNIDTIAPGLKYGC